ncbi:hypothetical protein scyTo_0000002 [Scyliorhinus torazame]|uniref:RZ-type domain-containing protein n=1 Tax=Scyliorhinus torazame TaxID=75743 RepID=A0A401NMI5_SCYTO|nr:hypothetical protein [Scyliorhinus torazame]
MTVVSISDSSRSEVEGESRKKAKSKLFQMDPDQCHRLRGQETELDNPNRRAAIAEWPRPNARRGDASLERLETRGRRYNGNQRNAAGPADQRGAPQPRRALSTPRQAELLAAREFGGRNQEWNFNLNPRHAEERQNAVRANRNPAGRAPAVQGNRQAPQQGRRDQHNERRNEPWRRNDVREGGRGGRQGEMQGNPHFQRRRPQEVTKEEHVKDKEPFVRRLGYKTMEGLLDKEPSEIVITLACGSGLKDLLSQQLNSSFIQLICKVLCKACRSKTDRQSIQHLLGIVKDSLFLKVQLPRYVVQMSTDPVPLRRQQYPEYIECILFLLQELVSIFPASSVQEMSMMILVLDPTVNTLRAAGVSIGEQNENSLEKVKNITHHLQERKRDGTLRTDTHILIDNQETGPEDNYRTMTIYPTYNEVHLEERPFLRPNLITEKYANTEVYLDTHFRLLREDFVRPLREGILELLQNYDDKGLRRRKFDDIRVYFNTRILVPLCTSTGVGYKVQFDTRPLKFVRWQNSKRLLYGSLVCMSKDNFETLLFATVSNRDPVELKEGIVHLSFNVRSRHLLAELEPSDCFLMVETTAYFEAYRHVLEGLQEIQGEDVPFQKYIVACDTEIQVPRYLAFNNSYDLEALMNGKSQDSKENTGQINESLHRNTKVNVLDPASWPSKEELNLDESQMQALQMALTKELAIIQGPPGTGKTYVGLKIVQTLLTNESVWQRHLRKFPILVVCYTNHALDQFLEGIYGFLHTGLVRVGGRSNSELLKRFTLKELRNSRDFRRKLPQHLRGAYFEVTNQMRKSEQKICAAAQHLECTTQGVLHEQYLEKHISAMHWNSLQNGLVFDDFGMFGRRHSLILEWLGLGFMSVTTIPGGDPQNMENADEQQEEVEDEDVEDEFIQISEEAELIQRERMIDDDEPKMRAKKKQDAELNELANTLLAMNLNKQGPPGAQLQDEGGWQVQRSERKKMKQKAQAELRKSGAMTAAEERGIFNIWMLSLKDRWRLYRLWLSMYQTDVRRRIIQHEQLYQTAADRLAELRLQEDLWVLKEAKVVGMTTTGAAKYRKVLQELQPRLVVVEEAAEVLEAHLITTLSSACQHLILIGDHQQLRPSATVYDLARNFYLEVSLFERLVKVNVPYIRLDYQHRMRPEIAALLCPHIYEQLENHPSVLNYENIKGVSSNLFFIEHSYPEEEIQDGKSHQNLHEAAFVVALCYYLICQDYLPSQITILTTYTGQLFMLRKMMPSKKFAGVKVHVVDKYQGEENDIILLSLVRSNKKGNVGFLQIANRVCVALSRAKKGLYCIGNMSILANVPLWSKIMHTLRENANIGPSLLLTCQNHPKTMTLVSKAEDFNKVPEGGCSLPYEPDARFVQLEDCCHIFEVTGFDQYMNERQEGSGAVIKLKDCPKCRMPIRKNFRYGAIIKNSLCEIEKVKKIVQGDAEKNNQLRKQLESELKKSSIIAEQFPYQDKNLSSALQSCPLSLQGLTVIENKIAFLSRLAELKCHEARLNLHMKAKFKSMVLECLRWIDKSRGRFTVQELTDLQSEIQRLSFLSDLYVRCSMASGRKLDSSTEHDIACVQKILECTKAFTENDERLVKEKMKTLKLALPETGLALSETEKVMIVKAMGLRQGHWFKCPNGHVYVITECGGAMERAKCPDCSAAIGGMNHALESSNQVASEMDGAQYSAWSDVANNMLNFEEL